MVPAKHARILQMSILQLVAVAAGMVVPHCPARLLVRWGRDGQRLIPVPVGLLHITAETNDPVMLELF